MGEQLLIDSFRGQSLSTIAHFKDLEITVSIRTWLDRSIGILLQFQKLVGSS